MAEGAGDPRRAARRTGLIAGWDTAPGLGAVLVAGPDAAAFLQAQLTSDVASLAPGDAGPSARLTRQGALSAYLTVFRLPDRGQPFPSYLLIAPATLVTHLLDDLRAFVIAEDVMLEDATGEFLGLVVQGPATADLLAAGTGGDQGSALSVELSLTGDPGRLLLLPAGAAEARAALLDAAAAAGFVLLDELPDAGAVWDGLRLEGGWLLPGRDYEPGKTLLSQTGLEQQAVSWTKGCYLGQEVVARVRTYGSVPRALRGLVVHEPLTLAADALPPSGSSLRTTAGKSIGTWASAGFSVVWDRPVALAYLDRDHRAPGSRLTLEAGDREVEAEVVLPPFFAGASAAERAAGLHDRAVRRFSAGADGEAVTLLVEALRLDPGLAEAYEALGVILGRTERYHEAIDVFKRLEEVAPDEPMVHTNLSLFYMKLGDKEEAERQKALATLKRFGEGLSEEEVARQQAAEAASRREDAARRRAMFAEVLALEPDDALALMGMGNALLDLEDFAAAEDHLARAITVQRDNSPLYVSRGKVLERLGRTAEAAEVYRAGVAVASRKGDLMPLKEMEHRLFLLGEA